MKRRLVWLQECVHGYEQVCSFGDCPGGVYEPFDYDKAWEKYYELADRRHQAGLTKPELETVLEQ